MFSILFLSIFWIVNGVLGLFGVQFIPEEYRGTDFEREYKRYRGIGWLLLGVPMFIFWIVVHNMDIFNKMPYAIVIAVVALPALVYFFLIGRKYRKLFNEINSRLSADRTNGTSE